MKPSPARSDRPFTRAWERRDVLKLGVFIAAAGGALAPTLAGCAAPSGSGSASGAPGSDKSAATLAGPITVLTEGSAGSEAAVTKVFDDFKAQNPGVEWDLRAIPGLGPDFDRLARAQLESGESVGLLVLDGLFVRAWTRDGLLADLGSDPRLSDVLARVPDRFHLGGLGDASTRAFPLALSRGVQTTGLYYNKALLDRAGLEPPKTIADMKAMVKPLAALGAAPLVHPCGDVPFNPLLVMWLLPMIAERTGDPVAFVESTIRGDVGYDSPEWIEAFQTISDLRSSGVLLDGSGAADYATTQLLFLQGKAAMTYNGTWLLPALQAGTATVPFDLHVAPLPAVDSTSTPHSTLAWAGFALPAKGATNRDSVDAFLDYASQPAVDAALVEGIQSFSPIPASNIGIHDPVAREFLPMLDASIPSLNWLWEPEIDAEIGDQVQALVNGKTEPAAVGRAIEAVAKGLRASGRSDYP